MDRPRWVVHSFASSQMLGSNPCGWRSVLLFGDNFLQHVRPAEFVQMLASLLH